MHKEKRPLLANSGSLLVVAVLLGSPLLTAVQGAVLLWTAGFPAGSAPQAVIPKASPSDSSGDSLGAKFLTLLELEDSRHARSGEIARRLFG